MQQSVLPDYDIPYVGGLCEGFVEGTVGQATLPTPSNPTTFGVYPSATAAWKANNGNHPNEPLPRGLRGAVYFKLGNNPNDHVAIQLEDGRVASSTQAGYHSTAYIHPNIEDLMRIYAKANGSCTYLGWSEWIGKVKVIEENTMENVDLTTFRITWYSVLGRNGVYSKQNALNGDCDDEWEKYWKDQKLNNAFYATINGGIEAQGFQKWLATTVNSAINNPATGNYTPILNAGDTLFVRNK